MARRLTAAEKQARQDHMEEHPFCWLCNWRARKDIQEGQTELHHIAGRGRSHECRENYASLCSGCHRKLQSRKDAELICLFLKSLYDGKHYDPERICKLRRYSPQWWTDADVLHCGEVMACMIEVMR